jgi:phosphoglycolate phosphatase
MTTLPETATRTWTCVLFDLDGTIADSAPGIVGALTATFVELGRPVPDDLLKWVGPPILDSFRDFGGMNDEESRHALGVYRRIYLEGGVTDSAIFPGITGLLRDLHASDVGVGLATSKPESLARRILDHYALTEYFDVIAGASEDEKHSSKAEIVEEALRRLGAEGLDTSHAVMVGDRGYDIAGAAEHGVPTIMVEWGYGSPAEATEALAIVHSADQLRRLLLG